MIGILGGTFDPVHIGHLRAAVEAREVLGLDEVRLIPSARPPHRPPPVASAVDRLEMTRRACAGEAGLVADGIELERDGLSYTVDTLTVLRQRFGRAPLCLLVGADAARELATWHRWRELFELAHVVVLHRPGAGGEDDGTAAAELAARRVAEARELRRRPAGGVAELAIPLLEVSASGIRARLRAGRSVRYLVPDAVWDYIRERGLYGPRPERGG